MTKRVPKQIPTMVTFLEMDHRPAMHAPPQPRDKIAILRAESPPVHFYRYLYDTIGEPYYWVERRKKSDAEIADIMSDPAVELYVLYRDGNPSGMAELDFRKGAIGQLAYFGLMPEAVGRRMGHYFLYNAVLNAWDHPITKLLVNTCTLDHPRALPLYQRVGFEPYTQEQRYVELP